MSKLLIGGDSFGCCGSNGDVDQYGFLYWWQHEIAEANNVEYTNISTPGSDLYSTSYNTLYYLRNDSAYTHVLFFITDVFRDAILPGRTIKEKQKQKQFLLNDISKIMNEPLPEIVDLHAYDVDPLIKGSSINDYLSHTPEFKLWHNCLGCLSQLTTYCANNNINLVFVTTCFDWSETAVTEFKDNTMLNTTGHFSYSTALIGVDFYSNYMRHHWTGHMSPAEHIELYDKFNAQFPNWLLTDKYDK